MEFEFRAFEYSNFPALFDAKFHHNLSFYDIEKSKKIVKKGDNSMESELFNSFVK